MKIYVCHSRSFDFEKELYSLLKKFFSSRGNEIIFPHDEKHKNINTTDIIKSCDLILAECSFPSTGLGIELGRAEVFKKRVICLVREDIKESSSLHFITNEFIRYKDKVDLINKLGRLINYECKINIY